MLSLQRLIEAAKAGDSKSVESSLKNIDDLNRKLADLAKHEVAKSGDEDKARRLEDNLQDLAEASSKLAYAANDSNKGLFQLFLLLKLFVLLFFCLTKFIVANIEKLVTTAKALYDPLENVANIVNEKEDIKDEYDEGKKGDEKKEIAKKQAKIILATLKPKGGAKVFTSPTCYYTRF